MSSQVAPRPRGCHQGPRDVTKAPGMCHRPFFVAGEGAGGARAELRSQVEMNVTAATPQHGSGSRVPPTPVPAPPRWLRRARGRAGDRRWHHRLLQWHQFGVPVSSLRPGGDSSGCHPAEGGTGRCPLVTALTPHPSSPTAGARRAPRSCCPRVPAGVPRAGSRCPGCAGVRGPRGVFEAERGDSGANPAAVLP